MTNYFTISEFARLRNININSLRYYEKIGVLKPAFVDERTGYRYYSPDQLPMLDVILLCIDFGMPLKDLARYINNNEFIKNKELFETGRRIAQERIRDLQTELDRIEYTLQYLNTNQQYSNEKGIYERSIPERTVVTLDYDGDLADIRKIEMVSGRLYGYAQEKRMSPVFPAGLLINIKDGHMSQKVFFEIMRGEGQDPSVRILPAGSFICRQVDLVSAKSISDIVETTFGAAKNSEIVVSNMLLDKYRIGTKKSELQKRVSK